MYIIFFRGRKSENFVLFLEDMKKYDNSFIHMFSIILGKCLLFVISARPCDLILTSKTSKKISIENMYNNKSIEKKKHKHNLM